MDWDIVKKIARDVFRIDRIELKKSKVLTVAHDNDRSYLYNGKYYSPLMDTIEDDLRSHGIECQSIARIISTVKGDRAYGNVVSPEGAFARALITKRFAGLLRRGEYSYSDAEERIWHDILDRTGAEKVLAIMPSRELCVACHKRGIWVADVQHGVIAQQHPWYGKAFRESDPREWVPDAFLCWDDGSADVINSWASGGVKAVVYGSRWVARFLKREAGDALVQQVLSEYREEIESLRGKPTIFVSLSWGNVDIPNGFLPEGLAETIKATSGRFNWLLRLHPNQIVGFATDESKRFLSYFEKEMKGHAVWEWPTRAPLPLALSSCDLHISWNSSVSIEAAQMGIKTALMDPNLRTDIRRNYYEYYRDQGLTDLIGEDRESVEKWIEDNLGSRMGSESFQRYDAAYTDILEYLSGQEKPGEKVGEYKHSER